MTEQRRTRLYLDNAATSFPKPPAVLEAMTRYATALGASPGRGAYAEAIEAGRLVQECRARINRLINGAAPERVVFTLNATDALNLAIKGIAAHHRRRGEAVHLVATWMEHNSVLRPYNALKLDGVEVTHVRCNAKRGMVDPEDVKRALRPNTRLVAVIHGSNVTGTVQPVGAIGGICRGAGVPLLVDAAQTLGHMPVDVEAMGIDLLAFPGHKGLLGPLGTGGLYLRPGMEAVVETLREGGTGSVSERDVQPEFLPDKYEPGSHNTIGILGLGAAVGWLLQRGVAALWDHERRLIAMMVAGLIEMPGLRLLGSQTIEHRCGVFSIVVEGLDPAELAAILEDRFGILTRPGIHCAPLAHETMGTHGRGGATRLSLGPFVTEDDVDYVLGALRAICGATAPAISS